MNKNIFIKYFLIIIGASLFALYFWNRFLRVRISKMLPLDLTVFGLLLLIYICCIFLFIIISLTFGLKSNATMEKILEWLYSPLLELDTFIRNLSFIKPKYHNMILKFLPKLEYLIIQTNFFYIIFWIIPRLILMFALYMDVFIFHQFHYKYMVILVGLLLFFNRYLKYSLKNFKNELIAELNSCIDTIETKYYPGVHPSELEPDEDPDEDDDDEYPEYMVLPLDIFVKHYVNQLVYHDTYITYTVEPKYAWRLRKWKEDTGQEYPEYGSGEMNDKARRYTYNCSKKIIEPRLNFVLKLSVILESYNKTSNINKQFKNIKLLIYINYLICWLYVLIISLPMFNLKDVDLSLLYYIFDNIEPFSQTILTP